MNVITATVLYGGVPVEFIREVERTQRGTRYPERLALIDIGETPFFNRGPRFQLARMAELIVEVTK